MNKKTKILLVEDDPNLGTLLSEYLVAKGNECTLRTNGQEGFETFVKGTFDFLILDVMMPVKDGFTMAKEIRGIDKDVPILFLTAKSLKEDTLQGFNVGGDDIRSSDSTSTINTGCPAGYTGGSNVIQGGSIATYGTINGPHYSYSGSCTPCQAGKF